MRAALVLGFCLLTASALAQTAGTSQDFEDTWTASAQLDMDNELACNLLTVWPNNTMSFEVVRYANSTRLAVALRHQSWDLPKGAYTQVRVLFGNNKSYTTVAEAQANGNSLVFYVLPEEAESWLDLFAAAPALDVEFPSSKVQAWHMSSQGTRKAVSWFRECSANQVSNEGNPFTAPPAQPETTPPANPFSVPQTRTADQPFLDL